MAVESHIHSLKARHEELENKLKELMSVSAMDEMTINDLKRRKLQIKDRIAKLTEKTLN